MKNLLRNFYITLTRFKTASILNILGLTVSLAAFSIIMMQTYWEVSYNKKIKQHGQIFRLVENNGGDLSITMSRPFGEAVGKSSPLIEAYACIGGGYEQIVQALDSKGAIIETKTARVSTTHAITEVLSLESLSGDFMRLEEPKAAIIPKSVADILFSENEPVGNTIVFPNYKDTLLIVAVFKDLPTNCTFGNKLFANVGDKEINAKHNRSYNYYYKLNDPISKSEVEMQANKIYKEMYKSNKNEEEEEEDAPHFYLEPFTNLYFTEVQSHSYETGNIMLTNLLTTIAIVIILIALINYINFFAAMVPIRLRAVNINKVFGTPTSALRLNFIGEAVGLLLLSFGLALLLVEYLSGTFINDMVVNSLKINANMFVVCATGILVVAIGILAGLFPAFYITKFNPALALKGSFGRSKHGQRLRSILMVFQFTISIILIISATFVYLQNRYMQQYDYGFNRECLVTVDIGKSIASQPQAFLSELKKNPPIEGIAYAFSPLVEIGMSWGRPYHGETISFSYTPVSWNYPEFMGLQLIEGRFFREDDASKIGGTIIFNETAAKRYNIKVGDFIYGHNGIEFAEIVGIVKDFNFESLQKEIEPLALYEFGCNGWMVPSVAHIRLTKNAGFMQTANYISAAIQAIDPSLEPDKIKVIPFDMTIKNLYTKEQNLTKIITLFSIVAILISLMGVFGIVVFENQHRKKEVALRKIHGSTVGLILRMFNRKFVIILLMSFVIAAPIAYFAIKKWLAGFAFRTPIYWWVFVVGFLVVAIITLLTVVFQTMKTANENPVKAVKGE